MRVCPQGAHHLTNFNIYLRAKEERDPEFVYNRWPRKFCASLWARFERANLFALCEHRQTSRTYHSGDVAA